MMTNLFSMFDPSTNLFFINNISLNWTSSMFIFFMIPKSFWLIPNSLNILFMKIIKILYNEFFVINKKKNNNFNLMFISIFFFILINNFLGLFPYIFTSTSHLSVNLSFSLPLWISLMMYGWINKTNHMFTHLVPQSTPNILIPFMILIESISNIIRPITLIVRLTANMIAGHLLLTLLGNIISKINIMIIPLLILIQMLLMTLEMSVSIIQSYVFSILITLYFSEI